MWFKKVDFEIVRKKRDLYWVAYNSLPYSAALFSDALIYSVRNLSYGAWILVSKFEPLFVETWKVYSPCESQFEDA